jgi:glutamate:Na+ symporter, ESS family
VPTVELTAVQVLAVAAFGVVLGVWVKKKIPILDRLNIPSAIVGGLIFAVVILLLRDRVVNFEMDLVLRDVAMIAFFTTIGMSASLGLVAKGGPQVLIFFGVASIGAVMQNLCGIVVAEVFGMDPLLGVVSGSVALTGGPATALAFGRTFEEMGVSGASVLGVASAMFGITAGGLLGGHIGARLIQKHGLSAPPAPPVVIEQPTEKGEGGSALMATVVAIAIAMGVGTLISLAIESAGLTLPSYVGAMIAAAAIRNLDDRFHVLRLSPELVDDIGNVALYLFIVMALMTLRLWEIARLALPMIAMLAIQIALVWFLCTALVFRAMGRDYQAAVMAGGFCGFMLGTTANAIACMDTLAKKFGPAPRAFIVVPLVGAFLIDFTNALIITTMTDLVRWLLPTN